MLELHVCQRVGAARPQLDIDRAGTPPGHEQRVEGWILTLDQPTYVAVVTDAESETLRRAFYEAWRHGRRTRARMPNRWTLGGHEDILRLRHEAARYWNFAATPSTRCRREWPQCR